MTIVFSGDVRVVAPATLTYQDGHDLAYLAVRCIERPRVPDGADRITYFNLVCLDRLADRACSFEPDTLIHFETNQFPQVVTTGDIAYLEVSPRILDHAHGPRTPIGPRTAVAVAPPEAKRRVLAAIGA